MSELESLSSNHIEAIRQNLNIDWRAEKPVFDDQMTYFCLKEEMADVEFVFNRNNEITVCISYLLLFLFVTSLEDFGPFVTTFCGLRSIPKRALI